MSNGSCIVLAAAVLLGAFASPARGQPAADPVIRAKADYELGVTAYNLGDYDRAIGAFTRAHKLDPAPVLLYNIAQAYRKMGDSVEARSFYRRYLQAAPGAADREGVEARIRELEAQPPREMKTPVFATPPPPPEPGVPGVIELSRSSPPVYRRAWFWGAIGVATLSTVAAVVLLRRDDLWNCKPTECFTTRSVP